MESKITILVLSADLNLVKELQDRTKTFLEPMVFYPCTSGEKIAEIAKKFPPDAVLVDDAFVDPTSATLVNRVQTMVYGGGAAGKPFLCMSVERGTRELARIMENGFTDIFTRPIDYSLFFQKLQIYLPQRKFLQDRLLYNMDVSAPIEVELKCSLANASEYAVLIRLNVPLPVGTVIPIQAELFGAIAGGSCLGKVISCIPTPEQVWKYEASVMLVAPTRETLSAIRTWMKKEYTHRRERTA